MPNYGDIVVVFQMPDDRGLNPKNRPCVVITTDAELAAGKPIVVAGITTLKPGFAPGPDSVPMDNDPAGHPVTGLRTNCHAFPRWRCVMVPGRLGHTIGTTPGRDMLKIAAILGRITGPSGAAPTTPASAPPAAPASPAAPTGQPPPIT